jgi:hypothetical protein
LAVILGGGWAGSSCFSFFSNRLSSGSVAGEQELIAVGGWQVHVDHLHGSELLQHAARHQCI